ILLWNNNGYGEIKSYMVARQIHPIGVDIFTPDFQLLAKGFGCEAVRLKQPAELPALLRAATGRKTATVIEIDESDYVANYRG
ncbi:MAG TPA: thiamine pyrophosphate-dependent enzyme, partial [Dongiaceae bacterium]